MAEWGENDVVIDDDGTWAPPSNLRLQVQRHDTIGPAPALDLSPGIRALGAQIPGADYVGAAGMWAQDRFPLSLGGAPAGQERDYDRALSDYRTSRGGSEQTEPLLAGVGGVTGALAVPWAKGGGVLATARRVLENALYSGALTASRGGDAAAAGDSAATGGLTSGAVETFLAAPRVLRATAGAVDRFANRQAWRALGPKSEQDVAAAAHLADGALQGLDAEQTMGRWARDARMEDGTPLLGWTDDAMDTARKAAVLKESTGAAKGAVTSAAEARGTVVDPQTVMTRMTAQREPLLRPPFLGAYGGGPVSEVDEQIALARQHMVPPPPETLEQRLIGVSQRGSGAQAQGPVGPGAAQNANEAGLIPPTRADYQPIRDIPEPPATPSMMAEVEEGLAGSRLPQTEAYLERTGLPGEFPPRLIPGTTRPAPNSGWTPVFREPTVVQPRTFSEWEEFKTNLQKLLYESSAKHGKLSEKLTGPAQEAVERLQAVVRETNEEAVKQHAPELYDAFMKAKREFGFATVADTLAKSSARSGQIPASNAPLAQHMDWATRRALMGGGLGFGVGAAYGQEKGYNPILSGLGGLAVGAGIGKLAGAAPMLTRGGDKLERWLASQPDTTGAAELSPAIIQALRAAYSAKENGK